MKVTDREAHPGFRRRSHTQAGGSLQWIPGARDILGRKGHTLVKAEAHSRAAPGPNFRDHLGFGKLPLSLLGNCFQDFDRQGPDLTK